jgi:lipoprotein-anchoring transpeptidase ErfK/SrfK
MYGDVRSAKLSVGVIFGVVLATALAACGVKPHAGVEAAAKQRCAKLPGAAGSALAAVVRRPLVAFRKPGHGAIERFGLLNVNGVDSVFGVVGASCDAQWLHVQLPIRPNGATGWIRADHVRLQTVRTRIVVDLSDRLVRFYRNGKLALRSRAAIGSSATPTPTGRYYVNQRLIPADTRGPFGPGAIGISAFSQVLTGWAQGGPVAIHGTNEPWSIGRAVSNGCIRVPNAVDRKLFRQTPAGTPVIIRS